MQTLGYSHFPGHIFILFTNKQSQIGKVTIWDFLIFDPNFGRTMGKIEEWEATVPTSSRKLKPLHCK